MSTNMYPACGTITRLLLGYTVAVHIANARVRENGESSLTSSPLRSGYRCFSVSGLKALTTMTRSNGFIFSGTTPMTYQMQSDTSNKAANNLQKFEGIKIETSPSQKNENEKKVKLGNEQELIG